MSCRTLETFNWKIDRNQTIAWGDIYVGDGKFTTKIDMADPSRTRRCIRSRPISISSPSG